MNLIKSIQASFEKYGWLLPIWIPAGYTLQRGYGNTLLAIYLIWAVPALWSRLMQVRGTPVVLYLALIVTGFVSAFLSIDPSHSIHAWGKFTLLNVTLLITLAAVARKPDALETAVKVAGLVGVLSFGLFILQFLYHASQPDFIPSQQMRGLVPAYLLPFALLWMHKRAGLPATFLVTTLFLAFLSQSDGRTEMLSASLALTLFWALSKRQWVLPLISLVLLTTLIVFSRSYDFKILEKTLQGSKEATSQQLQGAKNKGDEALSPVSPASHVTSGRTVLWRQALTIPPENKIFGVGPSNVSLYPVVHIGNQKVMHLHNFILDAWYETGVAGLLLYLGLFGSLYVVVIKRYLAGGPDVQLASVWLASFASVLSASMLEQSYRSYHLAHFSLFGLALFYAVSHYQSVQDKSYGK